MGIATKPGEEREQCRYLSVSCSLYATQIKYPIHQQKCLNPQMQNNCYAPKR